MSADGKANIKQQEIKDLVAVYLTFVYLEIQYKKRVYFSCNFRWHPIHVDIAC